MIRVRKYYTRLKMIKATDDIFYVYLLKCRDNSFYTGYTKDPIKRLEKHNMGLGAKYTRSRLPVKYVFLRAFDNKVSAMSAEKMIKNLKRMDKLSLIAGELEIFWSKIKREEKK